MELLRNKEISNSYYIFIIIILSIFIIIAIIKSINNSNISYQYNDSNAPIIRELTNKNMQNTNRKKIL